MGSHNPTLLGGSTSSLVHRPVTGFDTIWNCPSPPLGIFSSLGFPFRASPQGFKMRLLRRGFHTLIKNASFPSLTNVGSHNPPSLGGQRPRCRSVTGSDTICNCPSPLLVDIVLFGFPFQASPQGFKMRLLRERFLHSYKECFVPISNQCGISQK